jgi:hypothetical protein
MTAVPEVVTVQPCPSLAWPLAMSGTVPADSREDPSSSWNLPASRYPDRGQARSYFERIGYGLTSTYTDKAPTPPYPLPPQWAACAPRHAMLLAWLTEDSRGWVMLTCHRDRGSLSSPT